MRDALHTSGRSPPSRRSSFRIEGQRAQLEWPAERPFRILSIDGGGIRGLFAASLLAECESNLTDGVPIGRYFDLIVGASTGGIIGLALALGLSAQDVRALYIEHGAEIFPTIEGAFAGFRRFYQNRVRGIWRYRYEAEPLKRQLERIFGERTLGDCRGRICVPAFDGTYNEVHVFKTPHHPDFVLDWRERLVDVALATAAAPTFFPVYANQGRHFADGGVWANNPIMIGICDALSCFDLSRRSIEVLSIGSGDGDLPFTRQQIRLGGIWHWRAVMDATIQLQSQGADGLARALVGADHILRIAPGPPASTVPLDDFASALSLMPAEAARLFLQHSEKLRTILDTPRRAFEAFHGPRSATSTATGG
jgi:patatin-like phospholipase/acyl hydrolase